MHKLVWGSRLRLVAWTVIVFMLGGLSGYWLSSLQSAGSEPAQDDSVIFRALVLASDLSIPKDQVHCEVAGPSVTTDTGSVYRDTKLGDYLASYLAWSQHQAKHGSSGFSCEGTDVLKCTWRFGEAKANEGWDRLLTFEYNAGTETIIPGSLACVDVP